MVGHAVLDNGGLRLDAGKPRYDLIPGEFMDALAMHFTVGARKYQDRNWERGMAWCRCFSSMMRHGWAWMRGEDIDPETGSHHMVAVAWNACVLFTYARRQVGVDDRPGKHDHTVEPLPTARAAPPTSTHDTLRVILAERPELRAAPAPPPMTSDEIYAELRRRHLARADKLPVAPYVEPPSVEPPSWP